MTAPDEREPLEFIWYSLAEALELLRDLEDVRETLAASGHLAGVVAVEGQIRCVSGKLEAEGPGGGAGDE